MLARINNFIKSNSRVLFCILIGLQIVFLLGMAGVRLFPLLFGKRILIEPLPVDPHDFFRGEYVRFSYEFSIITTGDAEVNKTINVMLQKDGRFWKEVRVLKKGEKALSSNTDMLFIKGKVTDVREHKALILEDFRDVSTPGWVENHPAEAGKFSRLQYYLYPEFQKNETLYITLTFNPQTSTWEVDWQYLSNDRDDLAPDFLPENSVVVSARLSDIITEYDADVEYGIESWFVPEGEALNYEREAYAGMAVEVSVDSGGNAVISKVFLDDNPVSY